MCELNAFWVFRCTTCPPVRRMSLPVRTRTALRLLSRAEPAAAAALYRWLDADAWLPGLRAPCVRLVILPRSCAGTLRRLQRCMLTTIQTHQTLQLLQGPAEQLGGHSSVADMGAGDRGPSAQPGRSRRRSCSTSMACSSAAGRCCRRRGGLWLGSTAPTVRSAAADRGYSYAHVSPADDGQITASLRTY